MMKRSYAVIEADQVKAKAMILQERTIQEETDLENRDE